MNKKPRNSNVKSMSFIEDNEFLATEKLHQFISGEDGKKKRIKKILKLKEVQSDNKFMIHILYN